MFKSSFQFPHFSDVYSIHWKQGLWLFNLIRVAFYESQDGRVYGAGVCWQHRSERTRSLSRHRHCLEVAFVKKNGGKTFRRAREKPKRTATTWKEFRGIHKWHLVSSHSLHDPWLMAELCCSQPRLCFKERTRVKVGGGQVGILGDIPIPWRTSQE